MRNIFMTLSFLLAFVLSASCAVAEPKGEHSEKDYKHGNAHSVQLGPRPLYLVNDMDDSDSALKQKLQSCAKGPFKKSDFSIGHRGAALQFPEHTRESYTAAARMGAGIVECDVTFTKDKELVCRHSQCDLHTTTNILATPLAAKCSAGFSAAVFDAAGNLVTPASARCCASDLTLSEFQSLQGKMDGANASATTVEEYMKGTADFRTDLYASTGALMTHAQSIALFKSLGVKMTPELKSPSVEMPFDTNGDGIGDYSQEDYAQKMLDEYKAAGVSPKNVWPQSFNLDDVLYWINNEPAFGKQAVFLDDIDSTSEAYPTYQEFMDLKDLGVNIVAPPMWALVTLDGNNKIVPSEYATNAKAAGMDIITWTLERSGTLANGGGWYYQSTTPVTNNSGDTMNLLDVLARDVGVLGVFSDWPATVTYYANCMKLK